MLISLSVYLCVFIQSNYEPPCKCCEPLQEQQDLNHLDISNLKIYKRHESVVILPMWFLELKKKTNKQTRNKIKQNKNFYNMCLPHSILFHDSANSWGVRNYVTYKAILSLGS